MIRLAARRQKNQSSPAKRRHSMPLSQCRTIKGRPSIGPSAGAGSFGSRRALAHHNWVICALDILAAFGCPDP